MVEKTAKGKVILKAKAIISKHFNEAIKDKEVEIKDINAAIVEAQTSLHLIRYGAVSKTYAAFKASAVSSDSLHPEIKTLVAGKRPRNGGESQDPSDSAAAGKVTATATDTKISLEVPASTAGETVNAEDLPGYVAPFARQKDDGYSTVEPRGHQHKSKRRLVVGNVSKWIECDEREDSSTHKWMIYVRGCKEFPDISDIVKKVRFFIHQSYYPNNVIDVTHKPFHLVRRGWGEFPARIQIHFKNPALNKPVDVVHNLKLDKTYTGLQTLGAETLVDVWLKKELLLVPVKTEDSEQTTPSVEQNFTIAEDPMGDSNLKSSNLKRTAVAAAATVTSGVMEANPGGGGDCKKARFLTGSDSFQQQLHQPSNPVNGSSSNSCSPKTILKLKDFHHQPQSIVRPAGASLLKKMH